MGGIRGSAIILVVVILGWAQSTAETKISHLEKQFNSTKDQQKKAELAISVGLAAFRANKPDKALIFLSTALELKTHLSDYAAYHLGLIFRDKKSFDVAKTYFQRVIKHSPPSILSTEAQMELVRIKLAEQNWKAAFKILRKLERTSRRDERYPDVLLELARVSAHLKKRKFVCRHVSKIYWRFPSYTIKRNWSLDLKNIRIGEEVANCNVLPKERERRVGRLLLQGKSGVARREIDWWVTRLRKEDKPHARRLAGYEILYARIAMAERRIDDAIAHIERAQDIQGRKFHTQMFLAKALSQSNNYPKAVMAYRKAYKMSPRSRLGKQSLFLAAFLSYQNRDYDGASRNFEKVASGRRGRLVWDAKWHLAWMRYLKKDYQGAISQFRRLARSRYFRRGVNNDKVVYWRAMAELRSKNIEEARKLFFQLAQQKRLGYYTGIAMARLSTLPRGKNLISSEQAENEKISLQEGNGLGATDPDELGNPDREPAAEIEQGLDGEGSEMRLAKEQEEFLGSIPDAEFKHPKLQARLLRAQELLKLGYNNWARAELRRIERSTRKRAYLQTLLAEYVKAGDYYRSAYIADVHFGGIRERGGILEEAHYWKFAFPRAYPKSVEKAADKWDVSQELVWSVMRGESSFRVGASSFAGALGLMQMIPPTGRRVARLIGVKNFKNEMLLKPETSISFGTRYLKRLIRRMEGHLPLATASYNAGPHRVRGWLKDFGHLDQDEFIEHIPYLETRNYVKKVLRNYLVYRALYKNDKNPLSWIVRKPRVKIKGPKPIAEYWDDVAGIL